MEISTNKRPHRQLGKQDFFYRLIFLLSFSLNLIPLYIILHVAAIEG